MPPWVYAVGYLVGAAAMLGLMIGSVTDKQASTYSGSILFIALAWPLAAIVFIGALLAERMKGK